jgi:hypothetical protein
MWAVLLRIAIKSVVYTAAATVTREIIRGGFREKEERKHEDGRSRHRTGDDRRVRSSRIPQPPQLQVGPQFDLPVARRTRNVSGQRRSDRES